MRMRKRSKAVIECIIYKPGYFDDILFLPFHISWQFTVVVSVTISIISVYMIIFFMDCKYRFKTIKIVKIDYFFVKLVIYIAELIFFTDFILLTLHKFKKTIRNSMPYKEIEYSYIIVSLISFLPVFFISQFEPSGSIVIASIRLLVILRIYRVSFIFKYILNSVYLNFVNFMFILVILFILLFSTLASVFFVFFWSKVREDLAITAKEALLWMVPMLNSTVLDVFHMENQIDLFVMAIYVTGNCFLTRGLVSYSMNNLGYELIYQVLMLFSMSIFMSLIGLFAAILIHQEWKRTKFKEDQKNIKRLINQVGDPYFTLRKATDKWFDAFWLTREGTCHIEMDKLLPTCLYEDYLLDVYWSAFIHSHIFRNMDLNFLTAVSLKMKTVFCCAGDVVYKKGALRDKMIYILKGELNAMSSYDKLTPIVSFTSGSCLGESTLITSYPCQSEITCATNCVLQELQKLDFFQIRLLFPSEGKTIQKIILKRYQEAILLYSMKLLKRSRDISCIIGRHHDGALKKVKRIAREIDRLKFFKSHPKFEQQDKIVKMLKSSEKIKSDYIGSSSNYLDMVSITQGKSANSVITCITTSFPLILLPISPFVKIWNLIILMCTLFMFFMIPYEASIDTFKDQDQIIVSLFIQLLFLLDLFLQCTFAVINRQKSYLTFQEIFFYRMSTLEYKADIFGSVPVNIMVNWFTSVPISLWGLLKVNYVFRAWRILKVFQYLANNCLEFKKLIALFVYASYFFCSVCYWSVIFNTLCVYNRKPNTVGMLMINEINFKMNYFYKLVTSVVEITLICLGVSDGSIVPHSREEHISVLLMGAYFLVLNSFFTAGMSIIEILKIRTRDISSDTVYTILRFVKRYDLSIDLQFRIFQQIKLMKENMLRNADFKNTEWSTGNEYLPSDLRQDIKLSSMLEYFLKVPLFCGTDAKYVAEIADESRSRLYPPNEFVVYAGDFPGSMYILKKGYCQILSAESGKLEGVKGPGWYIAALELVMNIPCIKTVRTLTSCEVIVLSGTSFFCVLHKFPHYDREIKITAEKTKQLNEIPIVEGFRCKDISTYSKNKSFYHYGYNMAVGSKAEHEFLKPYKYYFGNLTFFNYFLLRTVLLPSGRTLWILEIMRSISALCSGLVFPAKIVFLYYSSYYHNLYTFLDFLAYIDLYFRLHVAYYNDKGILIKHPLLTAIHYLKHGFVIDLISCLPFELVFPNVIPHVHGYFWLCYNRVLQVHRVYGLLHYIYISSVTGKIYSVILTYCILLIIIINLLSSVFFTISCTVSDRILKRVEDFDMNGVLCPDVINPDSFAYVTFGKSLTPRNVYFMFQFYITTIVTQINVRSIGKWDDHGVFVIIACFIGYTLLLFMTGEISAQTVVCKVGMKYQRRIKGLECFLNRSNVCKPMKDELIHHFNMTWEIYQGKDPKETVSILNSSLRVDIIYHIYGKKLKDYTVFAKADLSFFRSLLLLFHPYLYNKNSFVLEEGFVHNEVYLLCEGAITILSGKTPLMTSGKGTFFGNLYEQDSVQQSITIIAHTKIEVLKMPTNKFYYILNAYINHRTIFKQKMREYTRKGICIIPGTFHQTTDTFSSSSTAVNKDGAFLSLKFKMFKAAVKLLSSYGTFYAIAVHETTITAVIILYIIDLLNLVFIILNMYTPYKNDIGEYVSDLGRIRRQYRGKNGGFWFDLFTSLPFETFWFLFERQLYAFSVLRFNRLLRFIQFLTFCETVPNKLTSNRSSVKIAILMIYFYSVLFFFACSFLVAYTYDERRFTTYYYHYRLKYFINSVSVMMCNFAKYPSEVNVPYVKESILVFRYCQMILTVLIGAVIMGYFLFFIEIYFFDILEYLQVRRDVLLTVKLNEASNAICNSIKTYLKFLWDFNCGSQTPEIINDAPKPLQIKLHKYLYGHHLSKHFIFSECHVRLCDQLLLYLKVQTILPRSIIVRRGKIDNNIYFIHKGEVEVYKLNDNKIENILYESDHFGTEAGLRGLPHPFTYKARSLVTVLTLNFNSWSYLLAHFPVEKVKMYKLLDKKSEIHNIV